MRRLKVNTIFLFAVTVLFSITSIGYSALSQAVTVGANSCTIYEFGTQCSGEFLGEANKDGSIQFGSGWYCDGTTDGEYYCYLS